MGAILLGLGRLFLLPLLNPEAWPAIALVAALCWGWGWFKGDAHGDRQCEHRIAAERALQADAVRDAGRELQADIDRLKKEMEDKDVEIAVLDAQAAADPGAAQCGLSADSVRRINRSRESEPVRRRH